MDKIDLFDKLINKKRTSIFIDAANILYSQHSLDWKIDYKKLIKFFKKRTNLIEAYFYSGKMAINKKQAEFFELMKKFGYKVKTKEVKWIKDSKGKILKGKGNLDIELVLDLTHTTANYDIAVIFSGDSDFAPAIDFIKHLEKTTIVISTRGHISKELIQTSDLYISFDKLEKYIRRIP